MADIRSWLFSSECQILTTTGKDFSRTTLEYHLVIKSSLSATLVYRCSPSLWIFMLSLGMLSLTEKKRENSCSKSSAALDFQGRFPVQLQNDCYSTWMLSEITLHFFICYVGDSRHGDVCLSLKLHAFKKTEENH